MIKILIILFPLLFNTDKPKPKPKCEGLVVSQIYRAHSDSVYVDVEFDQEKDYTERRIARLGYIRDYEPDLLTIVEFHCDSISKYQIK